MGSLPLRSASAALTGRGTECATLDQILAEARRGHSGVLVLRGEAGIGKTALLEYAARRAEDCRVFRAVGAEWEMELPFAGMHQLCAGLLDERQRLPAPQRDALATAFGLSSGPQPDRFLVALAVLGLLSDAAEQRPLVCLVDDVQWLDRSSAQTLAFVARRLAAESVVLLFAERDPGGLEQLAGLPELRIGQLPGAAARELLASVISAPMDERVVARLLAETRGNPLALLELPQASSPAALAGGFGLPSDRSLPDRIEASFQRRAEELPPATRRLLLLAAADPTGDPALLVRAAAELAIPTDALAAAEADGLLHVGLEVAFRHPLLRSAVYRAAPAEERRAAHRALAAATDAELDPDRRAWHRAHAADGPDEDVAREMEESAGRARARGGLAAAGAFLERAAALTADSGHRARRALAAAATKRLAGDPQSAEALLAMAAAGPLDEVERAMLKRLHGQVLLDLRRGAEALTHLVEAARQLEPIDPGLARDTHLEAMRAAIYAGRLGPGVLGAAQAARAAPPRPGSPHPGDPLLDGLAVRFTDGYAASAPALKRALTAVLDEEGAEWEGDRASWLVPLVLARRVAPDLFADDSWHDLATSAVQLLRDNGALATLSLAMNNLAQLRCVEGDLDGAAALLDEADAIAAATGIEPVVFGRVSLAGYRGIEAEALVVFDAVETAALARGDGVVLTLSEHARAVLHNGLGQYEAAVDAAQSAAARDELWASVWSLPELVEATTRCGLADAANAAVERLTERTRAAGSELALGIDARSRALVSDGELAEQLYREAIEHLGRSRAALELARARLLYGEWLLRDKRRTDARDQLHIADEMFASMGAKAFAARATRELRAAGETPRKRTAVTRHGLTTQELQIAQLARDGLSNPEIGARLFISHRTVEYHLRKVFTKLDISRREQLERVLPRDDAARRVAAPA
jgi:DNA-binding CsgD family transcriptional regulator